jgi:hypothetical protein
MQLNYNIKLQRPTQRRGHNITDMHGMAMTLLVLAGGQMDLLALTFSALSCVSPADKHPYAGAYKCKLYWVFGLSKLGIKMEKIKQIKTSLF